jgi:hypothetical protein
MDCHVNFRTVPRVNFLLVQLDPENAKSDCHVACPGVSMCPVDVIMTSSATCHADISNTMTVDFDFDFLSI